MSVHYAKGASVDWIRLSRECLIVHDRVDGAPVEGIEVGGLSPRCRIVRYLHLILVVAAGLCNQSQIHHKVGGLLWID